MNGARGFLHITNEWIYILLAIIQHGLALFPTFCFCTNRLFPLLFSELAFFCSSAIFWNALSRRFFFIGSLTITNRNPQYYRARREQSPSITNSSTLQNISNNWNANCTNWNRIRVFLYWKIISHFDIAQWSFSGHSFPFAINLTYPMKKVLISVDTQREHLLCSYYI